MSDVFYLRPVEPAATPADVLAMAQEAGGCFNLHRVDWKVSFLAGKGNRMMCWYQAPDAESARLALRQLGSDMNAVWAGQVTLVEDEAEIENGNVVLEEAWEEPQDGLGHVEPPVGARLLTSIWSNDRKRRVSLLAAPKPEETVALIEDQVGHSAWLCQTVDPYNES
jgi:hypothetical protein